MTSATGAAHKSKYSKEKLFLSSIQISNKKQVCGEKRKDALFQAQRKARLV